MSALTRLVFVLMLLSGSSALADASILLSTARIEALPRAALLGAAKTSSGFGVGAGTAFGWTPRRSFGGEVLLWLPTGVVETRGGIGWQLWQSGLLSLSAQTGGALLVVGRSALDVGLGPELGVTFGVGRGRWEVALGAQAGAEFFVRSFGPRVPLRALLQARWGRGPVNLTLFTRGGADLESGTQAAIRLEAGATLGWSAL